MTAHKYEKITRRENNAKREREKDRSNGGRGQFCYLYVGIYKNNYAFLKNFNLKNHKLFMIYDFLNLNIII